MNRMPERLFRLSALAVLVKSVLMMGGCASGGGKSPEQETASIAMPHETTTKVSAKPSDSDGGHKIYPGTGVLVKAPVSAPVKASGGNLTLNFEGADIREVVRTILGDILKENYIVDPRVGGTVVLRTIKPIPQSAALSMLEEILKMNGAAMVKEADGVFRIVPSTLVGKGNLTPQIGGANKPLPDGYSIQVVPLKFIGAQDMAKILEPLSDPGSVRTDLLRNLVIVAGTQQQLRHMLETIDMFDVDWIAGMSVGLFTLQNVDAKTLNGEMEKLFGDKSMGPLAGAVRLVPIERLNAMLVVTPQSKYLDQARLWIERLDRSGAGGGGQRLFVYQVQNGKAEQLATLLNDVFSKQKSGTQKTQPNPTLAPGQKPVEVKTPVAEEAAADKASHPVVSTASAGDGLSVPQDVRVIADKDNNALLILATGADYERIEAAIRKLDAVPRQVLIEVTIAEITLKDEFKFGLEWFLKNGTRINSKLDAGESGISQLTPGFSYVWKSASGDLSAILNMLATDSKLKVISSPHITVADNQTAKIQVGDRVPSISQTQTATTTTGIISTVQYLETGVLLSVKPRINAGGLVNMEISQEVSTAIATTTSTINSPTIKRRTAESIVTVQSGETLVLAGLISEEKSRASDGLPLLSEIPVLGGVFGAQSRTDNRTELIILITPRVVHTVAQASEITDEFRKRLTGLEDMLKTLDHEKQGAEPSVVNDQAERRVPLSDRARKQFDKSEARRVGQ